MEQNWDKRNKTETKLRQMEQNEDKDNYRHWKILPENHQKAAKSAKITKVMYYCPPKIEAQLTLTAAKMSII